MNLKLKNSITKCLLDGWKFIQSKQQPNGKWCGISFTSDGKWVASKTAFTTSLILTSLRPLFEYPVIDRKSLKQVVENAVEYLITESEEKYTTWNYWERTEPRRDKIPADMDDTSLALAAIKIWSPKKIGGKELANVVHSLFSTETTEGGPYNTWITDFKNDMRFNDCDIAVNANIAFMLSLIGINVPNLTKLFEQQVNDGSFKLKNISKYYKSPIVTLYFIARAYQGDKHQIFIDEILKLRITTGDWGTPMHTALALSALHYLGQDITIETKALGYIVVSAQGGYFKKEAFYFEGGDKINMWYHGSDTLTTSFCIEALCCATVSKTIKTKDGSEKISDKIISNQEVCKFENESKTVARNFLGRSKSLSKYFEKSAKVYLAKVYSHHWVKESILMPFFFADAFTEIGNRRNKKQFGLNEASLHKLSYANLCGWIGYSVLDEIIDGESPVSLIPFANFCLREMNTLYGEIFSEQSHKIIVSILEETDIAYAGENTRRMTKKGDSFLLETFLKEAVLRKSVLGKSVEYTYDINSSSKSIGQCIAGLGVLELLSDTDFKIPQIQQAFILFYRNYLEAKQDSDDAEDLLEDLGRGHISKVGALTLTAFVKKYPSKKLLSIEQDKDTLLDIFWNDVFPNLYEEISISLRCSEQDILKIPLNNTDYFLSLIRIAQSNIDKTKSERKLVQDFLKAY